MGSTPKISAMDAGPKRLYRSRDERSRQILDAALELFAENGFATTLQAIADRVGITQPLVHRYFPTKSKLLDAVKDELLQAHWNPEWHHILSDRTRSLPVRVTHFYEDYLNVICQRVWYRGFLHVAVQDPRFAQIYQSNLISGVLTAILAETRHDFGHPGPSRIPFRERELELASGMHSALVAVGFRMFIYDIAAPRDFPAIIRDQVTGYVLAAERVMRELHDPPKSRT
jgi:AcrR family transcriptional regulator